MKLKTIYALVVIFLFSNVTATFAASPHNNSAATSVLIDQKTGRVLYGNKMNESRRIASITKIMTALLAVESGKLDQVVTVSNTTVQTEGSAIYLVPGEKIKLEDLVYGLMLRSGNDAAKCIAEYVGGSVEGFAFLMNQKADELGMKNTFFSNPSGLDEHGKEHYSSAYDMAILTRYAMSNPKFAKIAGAKIHRAPHPSEKWDRVWKNKHRLVTGSYKYAIGGKTGFTKKARRTLVTVAKKGEVQLIAVTLNDGNDWDDHRNFFEWGFKNYKLTNVARKGVFTAKKTNYKITHDIILPLRKEERKDITLNYKLYKKEDISKIDNEAGLLEVKLKDKVIYEAVIFKTNKKVDNTSNIWTNLFADALKMLGVGVNG
ncbi:MAG: D-alanyl-D-alanine carboxypeptidase [Bacillales bacterium]|jgi:D-alanyl-D-alanine carboxypeptidase|nr:D-alanyl-D-alanine carboxypeptidase [Bacillales bacterium]